MGSIISPPAVARHLKDHPNLTFVEGSIADHALVNQLIGDLQPEDAVTVHTAASYKDPDDWYNDTLTNCVGGSNVVQAAKKNNVGRFVYFQTALCYGVKPIQQPVRLIIRNPASNSSYAISKSANDGYPGVFGTGFRLSARPTWVGPTQRQRPYADLLPALVRRQKCFVTKARRDFVFVKDLAGATVRAVDGVGHGAYHFLVGHRRRHQGTGTTPSSRMALPSYPETRRSASWG